MIIIGVEIKKAILGRNEQPIPGIEYCEGWRDFAGMGIACVCTYDIATGLSRAFLEEDLPAFVEYLRGKPTAGFNTKRFDIPLLLENCRGLVQDRDSIGIPHYDILEEIWLAMGLDPDHFVPRTHGGWGLDAVCQATLGICKTGTGALTPIWWQQGQRGKVIDYCLNDVWMEGSLLKYIIEHGSVNREGFGTLFVRRPETVKQDALIGARYATGLVESFKQVPYRGGVDAVLDPALVDNITPVKAAAQQGVDEAAKKVDRDVTSSGLGIIR